MKTVIEAHHCKSAKLSLLHCVLICSCSLNRKFLSNYLWNRYHFSLTKKKKNKLETEFKIINHSQYSCFLVKLFSKAHCHPNEKHKIFSSIPLGDWYLLHIFQLSNFKQRTYLPSRLQSSFRFFEARRSTSTLALSSYGKILNVH